MAYSAPRFTIKLKKILIGGAAVFPNLISKIHGILPGVETVVVYGSTEAEPISHIKGTEFMDFHSINGLEKGLFVGNSDRATEIVIIPMEYRVGQSFSPITTPDMAGEICVSGSHVLQGYIDNPEAEKINKIWEGKKCWHRTGDAGYISNTGGLFLLGRCKQIIIYQNKTYYPFLVEYFMQNLPEIICGTLLIKDEKLLAIVQPHSDGHLLETENIISQRIPEAKILFRKKIPMDPRHHSKIDYDLLKKII